MPIKGNDLAKVRDLSLFRSVSDEVFRELLASAYLQSFPPAAQLLTEGDAVDFLYVLLEGSVELSASWRDKDTTLAVLRPVSTFILAAVVLDADALMSATTMVRSDVLMISGEALRSAAASDAAMGFALAQELAGCYRGLVRTVKSQKLRGGQERLANYILTQQVRQGGATVVELPHGKRVLASLLGMTPENLSRAFAALAGHGLEVRGPKVAITDPVALRRLARPDPLIDNHSPDWSRRMGKADRERWPVLGRG